MKALPLLRTLHAAAGFALLEMAIVLFIIGLLIAGLVGPVEVQI